MKYTVGAHIHIGDYVGVWTDGKLYPFEPRMGNPIGFALDQFKAGDIAVGNYGVISVRELSDSDLKKLKDRLDDFFHRHRHHRVPVPMTIDIRG